MKFKIDDSIVGLVIAKYNLSFSSDSNDVLSCIARVGTEWICTLSFPIFGQISNERMLLKMPVKNGDMEGMRKGDEVSITTFGLIKLGPKTWKIDPIIMVQVIKAYVILTDVPEPAPWEEICQTDCIQSNSSQLKIDAKAVSSRVVSVLQ